MNQLTTSNAEIKLSKTTQKWLEKFDKLEVKSYADCFPSDNVLTLKSIIRKNLQKDAKKVVYVAISSIALSFNISNNFKEEQIISLVNDIFEFYSHLTMSDIKLFLQQVRLGRFGKNFNRLDAPLLFGYLEEYCQNRLVAIENDNEKYKYSTVDVSESGKKKELPNYAILLEKIAPLFNEQEKIRSHSNELKEFQLKAKEKIRLEQEAIDGYIARIRKDFEKLHKLQGSQKGAIMFVTYRKKQMTFEEYYSAIYEETFNNTP